MEKSLVLIKPDAIQRSLVGEVIRRLENKGLKLVGMKMMQLQDTHLNDHYAHLSHQPFFGEIKQFMASIPVVVTCWEGVDCVATLRRICGVTKAREAAPGTIRGDLAMSIQLNIVHASDSVEAAEQEINRFFSAQEIFEYSISATQHIYSNHEANS